jgi:cytochrome c556
MIRCMKGRMLVRGFALLVVLSLIVLPALVCGHERAGQNAPTAPAGQSDNPLVKEMATLDAVFREVVSGVSLGDGARVHQALEAMHGTMEKTHEGVHHGTVTIPKNAAREKEFMGLDKKFHAGLETLSRAAHKNDQQAMLKLTKELLDGCVQCHRTFRNQ